MGAGKPQKRTRTCRDVGARWFVRFRSDTRWAPSNRCRDGKAQGTGVNAPAAVGEEGVYVPGCTLPRGAVRAPSSRTGGFAPQSQTLRRIGLMGRAARLLCPTSKT